MKYRLSPREITLAPPSGFPSGSGDISSYTPPLVTIQLHLTSKTDGKDYPGYIAVGNLGMITVTPWNVIWKFQRVGLNPKFSTAIYGVR